jgi:hypothetical protein
MPADPQYRLYSPGRISPLGDDHSPRVAECWLKQLASGGQVQPTMYWICSRGRMTERLGSALEGMRLEAGCDRRESVAKVDVTRRMYRGARPC